ncbi:uncharacterized protein LOC115445315 [Manduca sexta]|uniref:uncharacterized protein LOC115445315 n=1 Tax=Manduca sexta TaxID=7130 RepID=UPI00188F6F82|nr:uncharacterized protein LOC115445315 [Manduca sexta]
MDIPKPPDPYIPEEPNVFEKPFLPPKPIPHSPKISPSSIPNPSPSVTTNKPIESGYPNYGGYLYSIPGYSAFQPVSYPPVVPPQPEPNMSKDFAPFPTSKDQEAEMTEEIKEKPQTDFEEHFTPEIIPAASASDVNQTESKMSITSLAQGSGATVTIPSQPVANISTINKEIKKKPERFSLKTSIPISKIDMKCVTQPMNPSDTLFQTPKKPSSYNPMFTKESGPKIEIQSNIVIKSANKDPDVRSEVRQEIRPDPLPEIRPDMRPDLRTDIRTELRAEMRSELRAEIRPDLRQEIRSDLRPEGRPDKRPDIRAELRSEIRPDLRSEIRPELRPDIRPEPKNIPTTSNSITTLINAAEVINKNENQFRIPDPPPDLPNDAKDPVLQPRPLFNPLNIESKVNFPNKPGENFNDQKNQILLIQNKPSNSKMLLTIQQQNPQVLLQRTNFDPKNLQAPSRLSNQSKKCKEELNENTPSKVVALKRLHQENCDENDFENLITENQIYGNKIVVKEKSQGTLQEQDLKKSKTSDKQTQQDSKNVVLQPNFLYVSNVQFPANLMMIKNNGKVNQSAESNKMKVTQNENIVTTEIITNSPDVTPTAKTQIQNVNLSKDLHVLKSNNNVIQTISTNNKDLVLQPNQKVIMNPQIVYQMPMIVESDNKINQPTLINREYPIIQKPEQKQFEQSKNDKVFISCPYQVDSKLQPKIFITNIRPKVSKVEEVSSLDLYEKRKRLRRLKYLSNREFTAKDVKKDKPDGLKNIITPDKMTAEIYKEFSNTKKKIDEGSSESSSDYGEDDLNEYAAIIKEYSVKTDKEDGKVEFLAGLKLATRDAFKDKKMELQERILRLDSVASAYVSAGRLDRLAQDSALPISSPPLVTRTPDKTQSPEPQDVISLHKKQMFLSQLRLAQVTNKFKEDYERTWREILKERKRRNGVTDVEENVKQRKILDLDPNSQLQLLTEIKNSVNENNNRIKKHLDSICSDNEDSIRVLAEKNFSELNRLSKMADRSVKLFSGQDMKKRDLNPGFDSENIQKASVIEKYQPPINIPSISKIISLKSTQETCAVASSQATSMDEPQNSAAGVSEMFQDNANEKTRDYGCQVEESWPGLEAIIKSYRDFDAARRREMADLQRRNTNLRVECAHVTRSASRESDRARALLAERQNLAVEENNLRTSIQRLRAAVEAITNS